MKNIINTIDYKKIDSYIIECIYPTTYNDADGEVEIGNLTDKEKLIFLGKSLKEILSIRII